MLKLCIMFFKKNRMELLYDTTIVLQEYAIVHLCY